MSDLRPWQLVRGVRHRARDAARTAANVSQFAHPVPVTLQLLWPRLRLLCYPGQPSRWQVLYKICALNGYRITTNPGRRYDLAIHFASAGPCQLPRSARVLNRTCTDVSKAHVSEVFERVFGYGLTVDPASYCGAIVEKSDANYTHDGRILQGPLTVDDVRPGRVYQRLIDTADGDEGVDLRTPLYGGRVPLVYVKRRPLASRFANENTSVAVREAADIYSAAELERLARFGAEMGLDFGELDVLRDRTDGRIYVVDVANTPAGPPNGLPAPDARIAIARLAREFAALVENGRRAASEPVV